MERKDILNKIREILHVNMKITSNPELISEETDLVKDYNIDSMQIMSFIVELEEGFDMVIVSEDLDIETLTKINILIEYIIKNK